MSFTLSGQRILITGAAMGMGRMYAERALAEGAQAVVLWDVNKKTLTQTHEELSSQSRNGQQVLPMIVDLASRMAIEQAAQKVIRDIGGVDIVINNVGIVRGKLFWEHENEADIDLTMKINVLAAMYTTREFLPGMIERSQQARIVNIASAAGMLANPKMSVYASSKWAMIGWGESVRLELKQQGISNIKVTTVCPSYISTGMFEGVKSPLFTPVMKPEYVVNKAWHAMLRGKPMVMLPWTVHLSKFLKGVLPVSWFDAIAGKIFGVYNTMDTFVGRK